MRRMCRVKICGITNLTDALVAADAGADYLGFILWPESKRAADPASVASISSVLRRRPQSPLLVGVFVDASGDEVAMLLDECGLDLAQLHGAEAPWLVGDPNSPIFGRCYKALRPTSLAEGEAEAEWFDPPNRNPEYPAMLIDTFHPTLPGGTGRLSNWSLASALAKRIPGMMLAGGLTPENVTAAIETVSPFAVDVASGVESAPGVKNHEAVRAFISAAHL